VPGGQVAVRGYLVQTLIALLDVLDDDHPWLGVTVEPNVKSDKVDILWRYQDSSKAVQVKSSQNPFRRAVLGRWSEELESWKEADHYELILVGQPDSPAVAAIRFTGKVTIPPAKNLDLRAFMEQAAHRVRRFLRSQSLPEGNAHYREMVADALAGRLAYLSTEGEEITKTDLVNQRKQWIPAPVEPAEFAAARVEPVPSTEIKNSVSSLYRRLFEEATPRGVKRLLYEAERLPKEDPDVGC